MKLYIIRHGETKLNALGRLQGWTDEPLNQNGKDLAIITGEALKEIPFDLVITSPLKRARETGELTVAASEKNFGRKIPIIEDRRIMEFNWGCCWAGTGKTPGTCPGGTRRTLTASGCRRSCSSRPAWRRS